MSTAPRADGRQADQLRKITFEANIAPHASGSVLVSFGATRVICAATIEPKVPSWMRQQGVPGGWLTAEYSMLPYSTLDRKQRDSSKGKVDGRSVEIQRLIGRSLRAVIDLQKLGENTLWVDCDVLQADGGTRTASITGAYLAARLAIQKLLDANKIKENPISDSIAAVSVDDNSAPIRQRAVGKLTAEIAAMDDAYGATLARRFLSVDPVNVPGAERLNLTQLADWAKGIIEQGAC